MSQSSIYESNWINLVFENRNKEYGAYQLRQESTKTSLLALLVSISICTTLFIIPKVFNAFENKTTQTTACDLPIVDTPITVVTVDLTHPKPIQKPKTEVQTQQVVREIIVPKSFSNPVIVHSNEATDKVPTTENIKNTIPVDPNAIIGTQTTAGSGTTTNIIESPAPIDYGNKVVSTAILDKYPSFPGGMDKFYSYIGRNFETPEINEEKTIRFFVSFIVEKDGSMTDIHVKTDPGYSLSKEAIRVLQSLKTKWAPGIIDSKPVRTSYSLPITVQMN